jgi:hypothetical protein
MFKARIAAVIAFFAAASLNPVTAQEGKATLYAFHTGPVIGGCPGLDWHVTLFRDNTLTGFVAWDQGQHVARLSGKVNKDRTVEVSAQEVGGTGRTATVTGRAGGQYINLEIKGSGSACDGVNLAIPRATGGAVAG